MYSVTRITVDNNGRILYQETETANFSTVATYMRMYDSNNNRMYKIIIRQGSRVIYQK